MAESSQLQEIDPDGDVVLIYYCIHESFQCWAEHPESNTFNDAAASTEKKRKYSVAFGGNTTVVDSVDSGVTSQSPPERHTNQLAATNTPAREHQEEVTSDECHQQQDPVRLRVSSKHLKLASVYFHARDPKEFQEANYPDSDAMLTLMNIIHGRHRSVPRQLSLVKLARIAYLVESYHCNEVVDVFAERWISSLMHTLPMKYDRSLVLWLYISHIFSREDIFKSMTRIAIMSSTRPIVDMDLRIPLQVIDIIEQRRQDALDQIITHLHGLTTYFGGVRTKCSFECSSMLLGALTKQLETTGLLNPTPTKPFMGHSVTGIATVARNFTDPQWSSIAPSMFSSLAGPHSCKLGAFVNAAIKSVEDGIEGLDLAAWKW
ncbi:Nuclear pore protein-like protein [Apiospora arundinis]|uniref:Nuclear pore protein-like protein n=1 Tax=Apiospora arundinis TaxID=335852 RepID=A0ABR2HPL9_9PEZI